MTYIRLNIALYYINYIHCTLFIPCKLTKMKRNIHIFYILIFSYIFLFVTLISKEFIIVWNWPQPSSPFNVRFAACLFFGNGIKVTYNSVHIQKSLFSNEIQMILPDLFLKLLKVNVYDFNFFSFLWIENNFVIIFTFYMWLWGIIVKQVTFYIIIHFFVFI